jgi:hypothetical protein
MTDTVRGVVDLVHDAISSGAQPQHRGRAEGKGAAGSGIFDKRVYGR